MGEGRVDQVNPVNLVFEPVSEVYGLGHVQVFPSYVKPLKVAGVKWLGGYKQNRKRGLPSISAIDILTDAETGMPIAIIDGGSITAMRTAGHAGVGAYYLARKDSRVVTIIGCGVEGRSHLRTIYGLFSIQEVRAFDVIQEVAEQFKYEMSEELKMKISIFGSVREVVKDADVVCMTTTALEPVVMADWIEPGCHVCATATFKDLDPNCAVEFDKWVIGWYGRDLEWVEGKERAKATPYTRKNIYADLATEIIPGKKPGRETDRERTVMTHMGMAALDVAVASMVYDEAKDKESGIILKIF